MEWLIVGLIVLAIIVVAFVAFTVTLAAVINKVVFGTRQDKIPDYKYFDCKDFGVSSEELPVSLYGVNLSAKIYSVKPAEECERVVIFQHGFGAGTSSYMTEIAHFARQGFAVVAADSYGCNDSAGKNIKGFYAGAEAVIAAYAGVNCDERLKNKKIILVGHSWGAYSVLVASARIKVDGVVAISAFNAPAQCLCDQLKNMSKITRRLAPLLHGAFWLLNLLKFGAKGNSKAAKRLKKSGVKALLIHGENDLIVPLNHSAAAKADGGSVQKLVLPDKKHNPYNTVAAEEKLAELSDGKEFKDAAEEAEYYKNFDWAAATEEDEAVMSKIDEFIENI